MYSIELNNSVVGDRKNMSDLVNVLVLEHKTASYWKLHKPYCVLVWKQSQKYIAPAFDLKFSINFTLLDSGQNSNEQWHLLDERIFCDINTVNIIQPVDCHEQQGLFDVTHLRVFTEKKVCHFLAKPTAHNSWWVVAEPSKQLPLGAPSKYIPGLRP